MPRLRAVASIAIFAVSSAACGSSHEWKPPPVATIPIAPLPPGVQTAAPAAPAPTTTPTAAPTGAALSPKAAVAAMAASPVGGELPTDLAQPLFAHSTCAKKECALTSLYPLMPEIDDRAPIAAWSHDLTEAQNAVTVPRHADVDLYGVVIQGSVELRGAEAKEGKTLGRWWAFRAPGAGAVVVAKEPKTRVVLALATSGGPLSAARANAAKAVWKERPSGLETVDLGAAKDLGWGGGSMHARIGFEGDKQRASLGILIASKDAGVPQHQHDGSWELIAAMRAEGSARRADKPGATELATIPVKDGGIIVVPKAAQHAWIAGGKKPLIALQMYAPPGPEQRFKKLAAEAR